MFDYIKLNETKLQRKTLSNRFDHKNRIASCTKTDSNLRLVKSVPLIYLRRCIGLMLLCKDYFTS